MKFSGFYSIALLILTLLSGAIVDLSAQTDLSRNPVVRMDARRFDAWIDSTTQKIERDRESPTTMTIALVERLKSGIFTTDEAILSTVTSWIMHDQRLKEYLGANHSGPTYAQSLAYLDGLLLYMYGRPRLEARLWERKAHLFNLENRREEEIDASRRALTILDPAQVDLAQMRLDLKVRLGQSLASKNQTSEAEAIFLEVMDYNWNSATNLPEARSMMRESYVQAALGLIDCRKGELIALQAITFHPELSERLQPTLDAAISEAKK